jgi:hypothetical protein
MFGQSWNHGTMRKYVVFFGALFSDVWLTREDTSSNIVQNMKVPLNYGPKNKFLARLEGNPELDRKIAIQLPRMSFEITNIQYDFTRKFTSVNRLRAPDPSNPDSNLFQYQPVPYNIEFNLYIMVKNEEDGFRIIEQILPFFQPAYTGKLNVNEDIGDLIDVPISLNSVNQEDTYEGSFENRRAIIWTLSFTMRANIFGPTRSGAVIKQVEVNYKIPNVPVEDALPTVNNAIEVVITPGLTANGEPTSNSSLSIDKSLIESTDDYGFIKDIEENL